MSEGCPLCERRRPELAKLRKENEELHELAAHYRERYNELLAKIQTEAAKTAAKH